MSAASEIGVGVIGYGYWGPNLARNLQHTPGFQLMAISDLDEKRLAPARKWYPGALVTTDAGAVLARTDIQAVAIATPVSTHHALARKALEAGKDVLLTKPLTANSQEAADLTETARRLGRILMVDHTFVYSGAVRTMRDLLDRDELGELYYFDSVRVNLGLLQSDVNVLWDLAPHDLAILDFLVQKDPVLVSAIGAAPITKGNWAMESIAHVSLTYPGRLFAHIHVNWLSPVKVRRALIGGKRRMVVYDHLDADNQIKIYDKGVVMGGTESEDALRVQYRAGDMTSPKVDQTEALAVECAHFLECVRTRRRPLTDGEAGLRVVRLLELAQESMQNGGRSVEVRMGPDGTRR